MRIILYLVLLIIYFAITDICFAQDYIVSQKQLTFNKAKDYFPSWSPDGKYIAFSSWRSETESSVWEKPVEGGDALRISFSHSGHPAWSPDGKFIAFDNFTNKTIQIISSSGGVPIRIVPHSIQSDRIRNACWSPDGSKIAMTVNGTVYIVDLPTGDYKQIFSIQGYYSRPCDWSSDGTQLVIDVKENESTKCDIWIISIDGKKSQQLTDNPGRDANPSFSPDGSLIIYMSETSGNRDIWAINSAGGKPIQLTFDSGVEQNARWSQDKNRIAFASDRTGNSDIWIMQVDYHLLMQLLEVRK